MVGANAVVPTVTPEETVAPEKTTAPEATPAVNKYRIIINAINKAM